MSKKHNIYLMVAGNDIKIGVSENPKRRLTEVQTGNPKEVRLAYIEEMDSKQQAYYVEKELHKTYKKLNKQGEWFKGLSIVKVIKKIETIRDKHYEMVEKPRNIMTERLRERVGSQALEDFLTKAKELGAKSFVLDKFTNDVYDCPLCLYALTSNKVKRNKVLKGTRKLIGHINYHGPNFRSYEGWDESHRKFLYLDL